MSTTPAKENGAAAVASNDGGVKTPNSVRARERTARREMMMTTTMRTVVFKFQNFNRREMCRARTMRRTSRAVMRCGLMTDECEVCACGV